MRNRDTIMALPCTSGVSFLRTKRASAKDDGMKSAGARLFRSSESWNLLLHTEKNAFLVEGYPRGSSPIWPRAEGTYGSAWPLEIAQRQLLHTVADAFSAVEAYTASR